MSVFAICAGCIGCAGRREQTVAPDFLLNDLQDRRFYLSSCKGKAVLLNFWSTHCAPCMEEMPHLEKLYGEFSKQGVVFAGICIDPAEAGYLETLVHGLGVTYPVLADISGRTAALYAVTAVPVTIIISPEGMIHSRTTGYREAYIQRFREQLASLTGASGTP